MHPSFSDGFAQRGRGECRVPGAPAASCAHRVVSMHTSIHSEVAKSSGIPTQWFTAYSALFPEIGLSCLRRLRKSPSANLTPASRRQNHTPSPSASAPFVIGTSASTASRPASVTIASRPSGDETEGINEVIWVGREEEIFLHMGLDGKIKARLICPTGWFQRMFKSRGRQNAPHQAFTFSSRECQSL
jgi:hypothetical protein